MKKAFTKWLAATLPLLYVINSPAQEQDSLDIRQEPNLTAALQKPDTAALLQKPDTAATRKWLSGTFYTEVNYGYNFFGDKRHIYDFPHFVLDVNIDFGRGWLFTTEQEFERLTDNGEWPKHFSQMYSCNWAYLQKEFTPGLRLRAGILNIPVGLTSAFYGSGLTVYDPPSEGRVLPMKWHETAIALTGELGKWEYWLGYLAHIDVNPRDNENLGVAARINFRPNDALRLGVSGFVGRGGSLSMLSKNGFGEGHTWCNYADFDFDYDHGRWLSSGEIVYQSEDTDLAVGAELGFRATPWLTPFVRFDMVTCPHRTDYHETTIGINAMPINNVTVKLQASQDAGKVRMDASVNYTVDF